MHKPKFQKRATNPKFDLIINEDIKARKLFLLNEDWEKLGEYSLYDALDMAKAEFKDLIQISLNQNDNTAIVKMVELWKYLYLQSKDNKEKKANQKNKPMKEMGFKYNISDNDLAMKIQKVQEMLWDWHAVRMFVKLRGRELNYKSKMKEKFVEIEWKLASNWRSQWIKEENYWYSMILSPKSK